MSLNSLSRQKDVIIEVDEKLKSLALMEGQQCYSVSIEILDIDTLANILEPHNVLLFQEIEKKIKNNEKISLYELTKLLELCAPRFFHPKLQVILTWAPAIAEQLIKQFPQQRYAIERTLAPSKEETAAVICHEKYGHGFLYLETTLGHQVSHILEDYELHHAILINEKPLFLNTPWKRDFYDEHKNWLPYLLGSILLVEEGFAVWMQTKLLLLLGESFAFRAAYKLTRHPFSVPFGGLIPFIQYFRERGYKLLEERMFSPHKQGYDWIDDIYESLGYNCMFCVLQVMQMVMDIDFGITKDQYGIIHISTNSARMENYLRYGKPSYYLPDRRLMAFRNILQKEYSEIDQRRKGWKCQPKECSKSQNRPCQLYFKQLSNKLPEWLSDNSDDHKEI